MEQSRRSLRTIAGEDDPCRITTFSESGPPNTMGGPEKLQPKRLEVPLSSKENTSTPLRFTGSPTTDRASHAYNPKSKDITMAAPLKDDVTIARYLVGNRVLRATHVRQPSSFISQRTALV